MTVLHWDVENIKKKRFLVVKCIYFGAENWTCFWWMPRILLFCFSFLNLKWPMSNLTYLRKNKKRSEFRNQGRQNCMSQRQIYKLFFFFKCHFFKYFFGKLPFFEENFLTSAIYIYITRWDIHEHKGQIQNTSVKKYSELFFALFCWKNSKHKRSALFCSILTGEGRFLSKFPGIEILSKNEIVNNFTFLKYKFDAMKVKKRKKLCSQMSFFLIYVDLMSRNTVEKQNCLFLCIFLHFFQNLI